MTAIIGGMLAAACFAAATLGSARSTRMIGALPVLGGVMLVKQRRRYTCRVADDRRGASIARGDTDSDARHPSPLEPAEVVLALGAQ